MKIIDQKGRLFGKINLFDLLVLSILVFIAFFGFNKYVNRSTANPVATKEVTFKLFIHNVRNVTTDTIEVGDKIRHFETNQVMGEIIEKEVMPATKHVTAEDGRIVNAEMPERYDMILTVKGEGIVTDREITLGSKAIRLGAQIKVRTNKYEVGTTVFGIHYEE